MIDQTTQIALLQKSIQRPDVTCLTCLMHMAPHPKQHRKPRAIEGVTYGMGELYGKVAWKHLRPRVCIHSNIDQLLIPDWQPVDDHRQHIPELSVRSPGLMIALPDGRNVLIDGHERAQLAKEAGRSFPFYRLNAELTAACVMVDILALALETAMERWYASVAEM